jgi:hypothetical protein
MVIKALAMMMNENQHYPLANCQLATRERFPTVMTPFNQKYHFSSKMWWVTSGTFKSSQNI